MEHTGGQADMQEARRMHLVRLTHLLNISDMKEKLDPAQFANQKDLSLQHYLIKMINKILSNTDNNSRNEVNAVLATLYDWKEAFSR